MAVRITAETVLTIEPLRGGRRVSRHDRLTWTVLDDEASPWILAWEGLVRTESGVRDAAEIREASLSKELVRIEEGGELDASVDPP